jgi:hypothetical protein
MKVTGLTFHRNVFLMVPVSYWGRLHKHELSASWARIYFLRMLQSFFPIWTAPDARNPQQSQQALRLGLLPDPTSLVVLTFTFYNGHFLIQQDLLARLNFIS